MWNLLRQEGNENNDTCTHTCTLSQLSRVLFAAHMVLMSVKMIQSLLYFGKCGRKNVTENERDGLKVKQALLLEQSNN